MLDYWQMIIDILLVIVGLSAFAIYFAQKRAELYAAGTMIIGQIDLVEKNVAALSDDAQLGNISVYSSKPIIKENMWERYKHLFAKKLSASEYSMVQQFFDHAEQLERARQDIINTIENAWRDKSTCEHEMVAQMMRDCLTFERIEAFRARYIPTDLAFTPDIVIGSLTKNMNSFKRLVGTTAYNKIQKRSYTK